MNSPGIDLDATKGSSLPPFSSCPMCGFPDLPGIEPETLHLTVGAEAAAGFPLSDGRVPVHARGRIYLMRDDAWTRYRELCASAAETEMRRGA